MDQEFSAEWSRLLHEGVRLVRAGGGEKLSATRVAQFITLPAFTPNESLEIFRRWTRDRKQEHLLVRTIWRLDLDSAKLETPVERLRHPRPLVPTIENEMRPIPESAVQEIEEMLGAITVPLQIRQAHVGCDGVSYELRVGSSFTETSVRWWYKPPEGWEPLADAFHRIVGRLQEMFAQPA
jgi:hypothetical protein